MAQTQRRPQERPETALSRRSPKPVLVRTEEREARADVEPMTPMQASYLKTLAEEAQEPEAFERSLCRSEASQRIRALKDKLGLLDPPPHTD